MKRYMLFMLLALVLTLAACVSNTTAIDISDGNGVEIAAITPFEARRAEHTERLERLQQFAYLQNKDTVNFEDIVIIGVNVGVVGDLMRPNVYEVIFLESSRNSHPLQRNEGLIAELLIFTGIDESDIRLHGSSWVFFDDFSADQIRPYLLTNQAFYEHVRPYMRLREFALTANTETTYHYEVIVTSVLDNSRLEGFSVWQYDNILFYSTPYRFEIGLSNNEHLQNQDFINDMLGYAGLTRNDVNFQLKAVYANYINCSILQANKELGLLAAQWCLAQEFVRQGTVHSPQRGFLMGDIIFDVINAPHFGTSRSADLDTFQVRLRNEAQLTNARLIADFLDFTGISEDSVTFLLPPTAEIRFVNTRETLSESELAELLMLEVYMHKVNRPFWENNAISPVVAFISLPQPGSPPGTSIPALPAREGFIMWLYDYSLLNLEPYKRIAHLRTVRNEILELTGLMPHRIAVEVLPVR